MAKSHVTTIRQPTGALLELDRARPICEISVAHVLALLSANAGPALFRRWEPQS